MEGHLLEEVCSPLVRVGFTCSGSCYQGQSGTREGTQTTGLALCV